MPLLFVSLFSLYLHLYLYQLWLVLLLLLMNDDVDDDDDDDNDDDDDEERRRQDRQAFDLAWQARGGLLCQPLWARKMNLSVVICHTTPETCSSHDFDCSSLIV